MITIRQHTVAEKIVSDYFDKAGCLLVLKDVTILFLDKFHLVKAGTKSHKYQFCDYYFYDVNGIEIKINSWPCQSNLDYFMPITPKKLRKLKLNKINETNKTIQIKKARKKSERKI